MTTQEELKSNPLKTREDLKRALLTVLEPLKPHYSENKALLTLGYTSASYSDFTAKIESFARPLWGLAPLFTDGSGEAWAALYRRGFIAGTDPSSPEYWGEVSHGDQKLVEMAAMGLALILAPDKIWEPLTKEQQDNLYTWLDNVNHRRAWDCNWRLFAVMVNLGFKRVGREYNEKVVRDAFDAIESYYLSDGWYADGKNAHCDYYVPFAIYFYSLIYAKEMENEDAELSALIKSRAKRFAEHFIYFFSPDGSAVPFGRSMTYRFAQCAFWSAYAYAEVGGFEPGVVKGIILRNLRCWFSRPIFSTDGILTIGHGYPSLLMTEGYNAPGSPYWALKAFLVLALPENHPFWTSPELPLPELEKTHPMPEAHMIAARFENHACLFNAGYPYTNMHTHCGAKYEKFAYSSISGFSVPKTEWGLSQGAFDNALALSERDNCYRVKRKCDEYKVFDEYIYTASSPWRDIKVKTYLVASLPWCVRIHKIDSSRDLDISDGGFSFNRSDDFKIYDSARSAFAVGAAWASGAYSVSGNTKPEIISTESNTNLIFSRAGHPALTASLPKGEHLIVSAFYFAKDKPEDFDNPPIEFSEDESSYTVIISGRRYKIFK